jgi:hydroxypyruvate reductase
MSASRLRQDMLLIRDAALRAVDPAAAVKRTLHLRCDPRGRLVELGIGSETWQVDCTGRVFLIAAGKAAPGMAQAALEVFDQVDVSGLIVTKYGHSLGADLLKGVVVLEAGHPVPDDAGLAAAGQVKQTLIEAGPQDVVLLLISGGTSALLPLPVEGVRLEDLQQLTAMLLACGANIREVNTVRKHLDQLKGGGMARLAWPAPVFALILSDVVGDALDVIASGPAAPDPTTFAEAWMLLQHYHLVDSLPAAIAAYLHDGMAGRAAETPKPGDPLFERVVNRVIASNRLAALAAVQAAREAGYQSILLTTFLEGEARAAGTLIAGLAKGIYTNGDPMPPPACLVLGGETTVTLQGSGLGGRNQELALAAALALEGTPEVALMALATDGSDGPTDAAGAIVNDETVPTARSLGLDPAAMLAENNSYPLLEAAGALLRSGPTGTNVNDLIVLLVGAVD